MSSTQSASLQKEVTDLRNQLREKNHEISQLNAAVLSSSVDVDELKHHRLELRALNEFYKTQSEKFKDEAESAKNEAITLRLEAERARDEVQRARAEVDDLREALRKSESQTAERVHETQEAESEVDSMRRALQGALTEAAECRRKVLELEEKLQLARGPQQNAQQCVGAPPSGDSTSADEAMDDLDLEYMSDAQKDTSRLNVLPFNGQSSGNSVSHPREAMDVDTTLPSGTVNITSASLPSTSKSPFPAKVQAIDNGHRRSPSIELLDAPPPISLSGARSPRAARRSNTKKIAPLNPLSSSLPSANSRGKRKAISDDIASAPSKKSKASAVPPDATASTSTPGTRRSIDGQRLQPWSASSQTSGEVKMEPEEQWSPLTTLSPSRSPAVTRNRQPIRTPLPPSAAQPEPETAEQQPTAEPVPGNAQRPTFKIKQEDALVLPPSTVARYLADAPDLPIKPVPSNLHVQRTFLRLAYGGSDQQFLQYISAERKPSAAGKGKATGDGKRRLVFPMPDMNPAMPVIPGHSGLLFASRHEVLKNPPWGVFRRHLDGKTATWLYLGEYESKLVGKMTKEEFSAQKDSVKRRWAKLLIEQKAFECYTSMRARIALRKAGVLPMKAADDEGVVATEMEAIKKGKGLPVDEDDIIEAFCRGDEGIDIIRMQCVSYDHTFAKDVEERFPNYPQMLRDSKKEKKANIGATKSTSKKAESSTASSGSSSGKKIHRQIVPSPYSTPELLDVKPVLNSGTASAGQSSASVSGQAVRRSGRSVARQGRWAGYEEDEGEHEADEDVGGGNDSDDSFYVSE